MLSNISWGSYSWFPSRYNVVMVLFMTFLGSPFPLHEAADTLSPCQPETRQTMNTLVETWTQRLANIGNMLGNLQNAESGHLTVPKALLAVFAVYTTSRILAFFRNLKVNLVPTPANCNGSAQLDQVVSHLPGHRPLLHPLWLPGALIPTTWWNFGSKYNWNLRGSRMW